MHLDLCAPAREVHASGGLVDALEGENEVAGRRRLDNPRMFHTRADDLSAESTEVADPESLEKLCSIGDVKTTCLGIVQGGDALRNAVQDAPDTFSPSGPIGARNLRAPT